LRRTKKLVLPVCWLIGLAVAAVSSTHALNYIGHPRSYFFFDTLLPVALTWFACRHSETNAMTTLIGKNVEVIVFLPRPSLARVALSTRRYTWRNGKPMR
jgi:hypothetical protein